MIPPNFKTVYFIITGVFLKQTSVNCVRSLLQKMFMKLRSIDISHLTSALRPLTSAIRHQPSAIFRQPSHISLLTSYFFPLTSFHSSPFHFFSLLVILFPLANRRLCQGNLHYRRPFKTTRNSGIESIHVMREETQTDCP